jgi:metal-sulfur cluster biosynthetic enzyme
MSDSTTGEERRNSVLQALRLVTDPEVGINIVDLGLVYEVAAGDEGIRVTMTMTSAACPMHAMLVESARGAVAARHPGRSVRVELVWEPAWTPERMSDQARRTLGW